MAEYIEKQAAIEALGEEPENWIDAEYDLGTADQWRWDMRAIKAIPPADVRPVRRGRWIVHYDDIWPMESTKECSVCHEEVPLLIDCKFCPNCTAEMEVDEDG